MPSHGWGQDPRTKVDELPGTAQPGGGRAPIPGAEPAMRQLSPLTNLLLAGLSALGLVGALDLPWFAVPDPAKGPSAQAVEDGQGPMTDFVLRLQRTFSSNGITINGTDVLDGKRTLILVLAGAVIVLCTAMLVPALRNGFRDLLRAVALLSPVLVIALAVTAPAADGLEFRWGLVVEVALAIFTASAAWHGSTARVPRTAPTAARPAL